jgi:hypothetical protein
MPATPADDVDRRGSTPPVSHRALEEVSMPNNHLAARAIAAAIATDAARGTSPKPVQHWRAAHQRSVARMLSVILGVDPVDITIRDDPDRDYGSWNGVLAVVVDPGHRSWRFIDIPGVEDVFLLLGSCPSCGGEVPVADIAELGDLGRHLVAPAILATQPHFIGDDNHKTDCPLYHPYT